MNKQVFVLLICGLLLGCVYTLDKTGDRGPITAHSSPPPEACAGTTSLKPTQAEDFEPVRDEALLAKAIGRANQGALCQGEVYQSKATAKVVLYRAWNSTNPNSRIGHWWSFEKPHGSIADYRKDNEICYQWSPLDMLMQCTLRGGTKVVVGTGQSAQCSQYLTYPVSATQQVFIDSPSSAVTDCIIAYGEFNWK